MFFAYIKNAMNNKYKECESKYENMSMKHINEKCA